MYRLNPLDRNVLITSDEVIKKIPSGQDMDPRMIQNSIEVAEERFIVDVICNDLYEDFIAQKNVVVTAGNKAALETAVNLGNTGVPVVLVNGQIINAIENVTNVFYKQLWTRFLWRITAECVWYVTMPSSWLRSTAQGEMHNSPAVVMSGQGAASAELDGMKWKMDKVFMDRIDPLIEKMKKWLYLNKSNLTKYNCVPCLETEVGPDGVSLLRKSPWVHGIYDTPDPCCDERVPLFEIIPGVGDDNTTIQFINVAIYHLLWDAGLVAKHGYNPLVQVYYESAPGVYSPLVGTDTWTGNPLASIDFDFGGVKTGYIIIG